MKTRRGPGFGSAVALSLLACLLAPVTPADVSEEKFFKAIRKHDNKQVARYLEKGVPQGMMLDGLKLSIRRGSSRNAVLILGYVEPDDEALLAALGASRTYPAIWQAATQKGARFRDPATLHGAIRKGDDPLIATLLGHGHGLLDPRRAVGLRPAVTSGGGPRDTPAAGPITVEKYEEPAGMTALVLAVREKDTELVGRLVAAGADPDLLVVDEPGAVEGIDLSTLELGQRVTVDDPARVTPPSRVTALIAAVRDQETEIVTALLDAGASPTLADAEGRDPCAWATTFHRPGYLPTEMMLALCPDLRFIDAARHGRLDEITTFLDADGDPNTADSTGWTALHAASSKGQLDAIELLLARGTDVDRVMTRPSPLPTPLFAAAWAGHAQACRMLIAAGADLEALNADGERPLHETQHFDVIRVLVEAGADIATVDKVGRTAMTLANQRMDLATVEYLRERGGSYGPAFAAPAPGKDPGGYTSAKGYPVEGVLVAVQDGMIIFRGQLSSDRVEDVACKLTSPTRDARYFHAPSLVDASVPKPRPLVTLTDDHLKKYIGRIVRAGAVNGTCTWLSLPTARPDDTATPEQLQAALQSAEYQGNVLEAITTGRMTTVFPGVLRSFRDQVALVEVAGSLRVRCKLTGATQGVLYRGDKTGTRSRLDSLVFERPEALLETVDNSDIRGHVGKPVKVGPGTGRCEYFEMVGFEKR